jgi:ABC-type lipoprotein export system ATPase subunit
MLQVENLTKIHPRAGGEVCALNGVSFAAEVGQMVAVVGPSGSGKSTLLFALGLLARPTSGSVCLDGVSVYEQSAGDRRRLRREQIGFVFQTFLLLPYLTAKENVLTALFLRHKDQDERNTEAARLLEQVGLSHRAKHLPDELSVGERQRVALARAMAGQPRLLLADEPTGNLDPETGRIIRGHLSDFARKQKRLVIIVTHDPSVEEVADRVLRLESGRLA